MSLSILRRCLFSYTTRLQPRMFLSTASLTDTNVDSVTPKKRHSSVIERFWKPIDICGRRDKQLNLNYEHPSDHPKILIRHMEKVFIEQLLQMHRSGEPVTADWLKSVYEDAMKAYASDEMPYQIIVDMLTFLLAQYDLDWIRESVIPLVPETTDRLNCRSHRVLCSCIVAYTDQLQLSSATEKFVCQMYEDFVKESNLDMMEYYLTSGLVRSMLNVVCKTSDWRRLSMTIVESRWTNFGLAALVLAKAAAEKDFDTAFKLFEMGKEDIGLLLYDRRRHKQKYDLCFDTIVSNLPPSQLPDVLPAIQDIELEISVDSASLLLDRWNDMLKSAGSKKVGTITQLDDRGHCLACSGKLNEQPPTAKEVQNLKEMFYEKSIIESGIYKIGDPQSLHTFIQWLRKRKPYDLVVDGLNAFHNHFQSHTLVGKNLEDAMTQQLQDVVKESHRVLVVLRKHARKRIPTDLPGTVDVYAISNDEMDDVYTLYAALSSGPQCYLLSSDEYSDHMKAVFYQPDKSSFYSFCRWQRMRTLLRAPDLMTLRGIDHYSGTDADGQSMTAYPKPLDTTIKAQLHNAHWHVPIYNELVTLGRPRYGYMQQWLCLPTVDRNS